MPKPISLIIQGNEYTSISAAAKAFNCSTAFIRNAIVKADGDQGILDDIISNYKSVKTPIKIANYCFSSLKELLDQTGISQKKMVKIRKNCKTTEEFEAKIIEESVGFYINNNWYWCIKNASEQLGISEKDIASLLKKYDYSQKVLNQEVNKLVNNM